MTAPSRRLGAVIKRLAAGLAATAVLVGCSPAEEPVGPTPVSTTSTPGASVTPSPTPTPSLLADEDLPLRFPITGTLLSEADRVVERLHDAAGNLPVLRINLTPDHARLTALLPDKSVVSYQWLADEITRVDSDIEYLGQTTFDPADYPLESAARMFDIADLKGVRGDLILQVVEYRSGQVTITITSRPETETVFFRTDGSAVGELGVTSVADITAGLGEVLGEATEAYAVGFDPVRGYWADLPDEPGVVLTRMRVGGVPAFETRRAETPTAEIFDPSTIRPAALAKAIAHTQAGPGEPCAVVIDMSLGRSAPVVRVDCEDTVGYADLEGRDMTDLIG